MGYYSEVAFALTEEGAKKFFAKVKKAECRKQIHKLLMDADYKNSIEGAYFWYWKEIKWYDFARDYFPEIVFIREFMDKSDPDDFRFMIVGEEQDDVDIRGYFCDDPFGLMIHTYIWFDGRNN